MHRTIIKFIAGMATAVIAIALTYQVPFVHDRLWWRVEETKTYIGGILHPAGKVPTARSASSLPALDKPVLLSPTHTPIPTPNVPAGIPTAAPSPMVTPTLPPLPPSASLEAPHYEKQDINNCGPATLAEYLRFYGWEGDQFDIDAVIKPQREDRNVNVEELAYYVSSQVGWLRFEYRVGGTLDVLKRLIASGIPVVIEKSMPVDKSYWPNDDLWAGHYLLLTGYDDAKKAFLSQDVYVNPNQWVNYAELDKSWKSFNRVFLMLFLPEQEEMVRQILGPDWDPDTNRRNALEAAQKEASADPGDGFAWFNVGTNLVYFERYGEAGQAYDKAREAGLPQRMLRYQFGPFIAYFQNGRIEDLTDLVDYALERTPSSEEARLWKGWALYRQGDPNAAGEWFRKALEANPTYQDAQYALNFLN